MAKKKDFIKGAIKNPGALTRQAKAEGLTIKQFCDLPNRTATTRRRCTLMRTLEKIR